MNRSCRRKTKTLLFAVLLLLSPALVSWGHAAQRLLSSKCLKCHSEFKTMGNVVAGDFESLSRKARSFQVKVGKRIELLRFTPDTRVVHVKTIRDLKKPIPVLVQFEQKGRDRIATRITAKPRITVPKEKLLDVADVAALVTEGPEKGNYLLVDSRPSIRYQEGHIPTAVSIPFGKMPTMMNRLPKDKSTLLVFYCGGFR